nr:MAG TPA: hypothetical protein [Caudoviricetes sp.]
MKLYDLKFLTDTLKRRKKEGFKSEKNRKCGEKRGKSGGFYRGM